MIRCDAPRYWLVLAAAIAVPSIVATTAPADDALQKELEDVDVAGRWIYDDWAAAQEHARREKKPIFALFR